MNNSHSDQTPNLSIEHILRIPADEPERLFSRTGYKGEFLALASRWYADARTDDAASRALGHLNVLYQRAKAKAADDTWELPNVRTVCRTDGKRFDIAYRTKRAFELGEVLIGDRIVAYLVDPAHRDLFENATASIAAFRFANDAMRQAVSQSLPRIRAAFEIMPTPNRNATLVLLVEKTPDLLPLDTVLAYAEHALEPKHIAWIMTRLHNLACWLQWSVTTHNAIAAGTVFISPQTHTVAVLGGWWYAARDGEPLRALPASTLDVMPSDALRTRRSDPRIDLDCIRALGRALYGKAFATQTTPVTTWLRTASAGDAFADYRRWATVRDKTFGAPAFTPMNLTAAHIYANA